LEPKVMIAFAQLNQLQTTVSLIIGVLGLVLLMGAVLLSLALRAQKRNAAHIRRLNGELAHRAAVTQAVVDNIADGISVADSAGTLTFNPAAERMMGKKPVKGAPPTEWSEKYGCSCPT
jgi:PAS domain-containing protein